MGFRNVGFPKQCPAVKCLGFGFGAFLWILSPFVSSSFSQEFTITRLDGRSATSNAIRLVDGVVHTQWDGQSLSLAASDIRTIRRTEVQASVPGNVLGLIDGSEIAIESFEGSNDQWQAQSSWGAWSVGKGKANWLRFRAPTKEEVRPWKGLIEEKKEADLLIISRGEGALDPVSGLIVKVDSKSVKFDFEGQAIDAPISKLLGIRWLRKEPDRVQPSAKLRTMDGSIWNVTELTWGKVDASDVRLKTICGIETKIDSSQLVEIDFSSANLRWLSELEPEDRSVSSRVQLGKPFPDRNKLMLPKFTVREGSEEKDLLFIAPGEVTFRVPEGVRRFESKVVRTSPGDVRSTILLEVWEGDTKLWEGKIQGDPQESSIASNDSSSDEVVVGCDVRPDRKLRLLVRSESSLMIGCEVKWLQPRFQR